jgi:hypothetical protein
MNVRCYITGVVNCDRTVILECCTMVFKQVRRLYEQEHCSGRANG